MKLILIFVFVFSLGALTLSAEKISQRDESNEPAFIDAESALGKRSSDSSGVLYHGASRKRGFGKSCSGRWRRTNSSPVCFGAKNHQFGRFYAPKGGRLAAIKLVHLYGYVSCHRHITSYWSYWGCGYIPGLKDDVNVVVTTSANHVLFPPSQFTISNTKWSNIIGYNSWSPELVLSVFSHPYWVSSGQELRLWYGEDFANLSEDDNGGRACCDVYALFV